MQIGLDIFAAKRRGEKENRLRITVRAEGPTKVFTIADSTLHRVQAPVVVDESNSMSTERMMKLSLEMSSLSFSFIEGGKEQAYAYFEKLALHLQAEPSRINFSLEFDKFQIDNPSPYAVYPAIVVLPAPESRLTSKVTRNIDPLKKVTAFSCSVTFWKEKPAGILCVQHCDLNMKSFALYLEQNTLHNVSRLIAEFTSSWEIKLPETTSHDSKLLLISPDAQKHHELQCRNVAKYYFDRLNISAVEVNLSFLSSVNMNEDDSTFQKLINFADIEDARIWLSGIRLDNPIMDRQALLDTLSHHYKRAFILEFFKLVGAANVLGDPMAVLHHVGLGVWEFVSGPAAGLIGSAKTFGPREFIFGFISGTKGLLQNFVFAASNATTKASSAAHKAITLWGFDWYGSYAACCVLLEICALTETNFMRRKSKKRGLRQNLRIIDLQEEGLHHEEGGLIGAVLQGVVGLVADPILGAEENGLSGFFSGVRHGALGVVLIPVAAFLEMSAETALSIRRSVAGSSNIGWIRPPRWIPGTNFDVPYDREESMGRWLLLQLNHRDQQSKASDEQFIGCIELSNDVSEEYVLATNQRVAIIQAIGLSWAPRIVWSATIDNIQLLSCGVKKFRFVALPPFVMNQSSPKGAQQKNFKLFSVVEGMSKHGTSKILEIGSSMALTILTMEDE